MLWECKNTVFVWELSKTSFEKVAVSRAIRSQVSLTTASTVKPRTNRCNIVVQQLLTLNIECYMLHPFAHPVACCRVLLLKA